MGLSLVWNLFQPRSDHSDQCLWFDRFSANFYIDCPASIASSCADNVFRHLEVQEKYTGAYVAVDKGGE